MTCFPSLRVRVSSDFPVPAAAAPVPLTSWPSATYLPPSILTLPTPMVEPHVLVYEPSGFRSTWSGTFEPLVGETQPIHLPARLLTSACCAETCTAASTANITVKTRIGLVVRICISALLRLAASMAAVHSGLRRYHLYSESRTAMGRWSHARGHVGPIRRWGTAISAGPGEVAENDDAQS